MSAVPGRTAWGAADASAGAAGAHCRRRAPAAAANADVAARARAQPTRQHDLKAFQHQLPHIVGAQPRAAARSGGGGGGHP